MSGEGQKPDRVLGGDVGRGRKVTMVRSMFTKARIAERSFLVGKLCFHRCRDRKMSSMCVKQRNTQANLRGSSRDNCGIQERAQYIG